MDLRYFRQINLTFRQKAALIGALLRFIVAQQVDVSRSTEFDQCFNRIRNIAAALAATLVWWLKHDVSTFVIAACALAAGVVTTWVASILSDG